MKDICQDRAKASVIEDQLQALASTILEPIEELKPMHKKLLAFIKEEFQTLLKKQDFQSLVKNEDFQNFVKISATSESIETLNVNQSVILSELKKFTNNENDSTGWIAKIVENLKKVKLLSFLINDLKSLEYWFIFFSTRWHFVSDCEIRSHIIPQTISKNVA